MAHTTTEPFSRNKKETALRRGPYYERQNVTKVHPPPPPSEMSNSLHLMCSRALRSETVLENRAAHLPLFGGTTKLSLKAEKGATKRKITFLFPDSDGISHSVLRTDKGGHSALCVVIGNACGAFHPVQIIDPVDVLGLCVERNLGLLVAP